MMFPQSRSFALSFGCSLGLLIPVNLIHRFHGGLFFTSSLFSFHFLISTDIHICIVTSICCFCAYWCTCVCECVHFRTYRYAFTLLGKLISTKEEGMPFFTRNLFVHRVTLLLSKLFISAFEFRWQRENGVHVLRKLVLSVAEDASRIRLRTIVDCQMYFLVCSK